MWTFSTFYAMWDPLMPLSFNGPTLYCASAREASSMVPVLGFVHRRRASAHAALVRFHLRSSASPPVSEVRRLSLSGPWIRTSLHLFAGFFLLGPLFDTGCFVASLTICSGLGFFFYCLCLLRYGP
jgi:hypothetical protein